MSDTADVSEIDQSDGSTVESEDDDESSLDSVHLSWRMPPDESFSDWTIEILTTTTELAETEPEQKDVYHVHKCVLAVGRKSAGTLSDSFRIHNSRKANLGRARYI